MNIAFLGMGIMGSRMASNLLKAGHNLTVWNRDTAKSEPLANQGAAIAVTAQDAVKEAEVIITMLANPAAVESVATGESGFLAAAKKDSLWIDCSTIGPKSCEKMQQAATEAGIRHLDAPVAGTKPHAEKGELVFFVGGSDSDLEQARPLFEIMGSKIAYLGADGNASSYKLILNHMLGTAMAGFAEAIALGTAMGIPRDKMLDSLPGTAVTAPFLGMKRPAMTTSDFEAQFPLQWMAKDLDLVAEAAARLGVAMPVSEGARKTYRQAVEAGKGEKDFAGIVA